MEKVLNGIKEYLEAGLRDELDILEAELGVTVPTWEKIITYEGLFEKTKNILIEIIPRREEALQQSGENIMKKDYFTNLNGDIFISVNGVDLESNGKIVMRYAEAIKRMFRRDTSAGGRFLYFYWNSVDYDLVLGNTMQKICKIEFTVKRSVSNGIIN